MYSMTLEGIPLTPLTPVGRCYCVAVSVIIPLTKSVDASTMMSWLLCGSKACTYSMATRML